MNMFTKLLIHEDDRSPGLKKKKKGKTQSLTQKNT